MGSTFQKTVFCWSCVPCTDLTYPLHFILRTLPNVAKVIHQHNRVQFANKYFELKKLVELLPQLKLLATCLQSQVRTRKHVRAMQAHMPMGKYEHIQFHCILNSV